MQKSYKGLNPGQELSVHTFVDSTATTATLSTTGGYYVDLTEDQTKDLVQVLQGVLESRESKKDVAQLSFDYDTESGAVTQADGSGEEGS